MIKTVILILAAFHRTQHGVAGSGLAEDNVELQPNWDPARGQGLWYAILTTERPEQKTDRTTKITLLANGSLSFERKEWSRSSHRWIDNSVIATMDPSNSARMIVNNPPDVAGQGKMAVLYTDYENIAVVFRYIVAPGQSSVAAKDVTILGRRTNLGQQAIRYAMQLIQQRLQFAPNDFHIVQHGVGSQPIRYDDVPLHPNWDPRKAQGLWYLLMTSKPKDGHTDLTQRVGVVDNKTLMVEMREWIPSKNRWKEITLFGRFDPTNSARIIFDNTPRSAKIAVLYTDYDNVVVLFRYPVVSRQAKSTLADNTQVSILGRRTNLRRSYIQRAFQVARERLHLQPRTFRTVRHGVARRRSRPNRPNRQAGPRFNAFQIPQPQMFQLPNTGLGTGFGFNMGVGRNPFEALFGNSSNSFIPQLGSPPSIPFLNNQQSIPRPMPMFGGNQGPPGQMPMFGGNQGPPGQMPTFAGLNQIPFGLNQGNFPAMGFSSRDGDNPSNNFMQPLNFMPNFMGQFIGLQ